MDRVRETCHVSELVLQSHELPRLVDLSHIGVVIVLNSRCVLRYQVLLGFGKNAFVEARRNVALGHHLVDVSAPSRVPAVPLVPRLIEAHRVAQQLLLDHLDGLVGIDRPVGPSDLW